MPQEAKSAPRATNCRSMASPMSLLLEPPGPIRLVNSLLELAGPRASSIRNESPLRMAEAMTGLDDWGTDDQYRKFVRLCDLVVENPNVTPWGRVAFRMFFAWKSINHLRRVAYVRQHPEVRDVRIEAPLVILGWYRTGTTLLHNLLGADPAHRLPRTWEIAFPVPFSEDSRRDEALRRAACSFFLNANRFVVPDQAAAHYITPDGPEECFFLWENAGISTTHFNTFGATEYAYELMRMNAAELYEDHKLQLQILSLQGQAGRTWVLKCPFHLWTIDALVEAYPDARLVWTHREARKSLPSNCSLSAMTTSKFVHHLDLAQHGRFWSDLYKTGVDRGLASRARIPASRFADVRTNDLAAQPVETVKGIYDRFGMPWTNDLEERYRAVAAAHPKDAHGKHRYDLATFGLDEQEIDQRFADYETRFGLRKSGARSNRPTAT